MRQTPPGRARRRSCPTPCRVTSFGCAVPGHRRQPRTRRRVWDRSASAARTGRHAGCRYPLSAARQPPSPDCGRSSGSCSSFHARGIRAPPDEFIRVPDSFAGLCARSNNARSSWTRRKLGWRRRPSLAGYRRSAARDVPLTPPLSIRRPEPAPRRRHGRAACAPPDPAIAWQSGPARRCRPARPPP